MSFWMKCVRTCWECDVTEIWVTGGTVMKNLSVLPYSIPETLFSLPLLLTHVSDSILPPLPICKTVVLLDVFMCPYMFTDMAEKFNDIQNGHGQKVLTSE
jgi:hypothetical protein